MASDTMKVLTAIWRPVLSQCLLLFSLLMTATTVVWAQNQTLDERGVLSDLYDATNGLHWRNQEGWKEEGLDHCMWEGVGCNVEGRVVTLDLSENALIGTVPDLGILNLTTLNLSGNQLKGTLNATGLPWMRFLETLNLAGNTLNGTLDAIQNNTALSYIDLSANWFEGTIAETLFQNLTALQVLNLSKNSLQGTLSSYLEKSLNSTLRQLDLSGNRFSGFLEPTGLFNLTSLESLNLADNEFQGSIEYIGNMTNLTLLDLARNSLAGSLGNLSNLTQLRYLDMSDNSFSGPLPNVANLTQLEYLNVSSNILTGPVVEMGIDTLSSLKTLDLSKNSLNGSLFLNPAFLSINHLDISHNNFTNGLSDLLSDLSELEYLNVAKNKLNGTIPTINFPRLRLLNCSFNEFTGRIPDLSSMVALEHLDLSYQLRSSFNPNTGVRSSWGLEGQIPGSVGRLVFLQSLVLSHNLLESTIPAEIARLQFLQYIQLENNRLIGQIPSALNSLAQLVVLGLAQNKLSGPIPELGGSAFVIRTVSLRDNVGLETPAPFILCDIDDLDLRGNEQYCPPERLALVAFYQSTKGDDWNNNANWLSPSHHCEWYGVECDVDNGPVLSIDLARNGLAGSIPPDLFNLSGLQSIDLNDNDIRGTVPSEISKAVNLRKLRLSYNMLTGLPTTLGTLGKLSLLHIHQNRIGGSDEFITVQPDQDVDHGFIADCGDPTDSLEPFVCENCDMCCNSFEECQVPVNTGAQLKGAGSTIAILIFTSVLGFLTVYGAAVCFLARKLEWFPLSHTVAREACGDESVYSFVLSDSVISWLIAFGAVFIQAATYSLFINASLFSSDDSDWVYSWRCPRNSIECNDDRDLGALGWAVWTLLIVSTLLDSLVNSLKLIYLAATRLSLHAYAGSFFVAGVTVLSIYTSIQYNRAIAVTSTELIVNAVILLFLNDLDKQLFSAIQVIAPDWVEAVKNQAEKRSRSILEDNKKPREQSDTEERQGSDEELENQMDSQFFFSARSDFLNETDTASKFQSLQRDIAQLQTRIKEMEATMKN